MQEVTSPYLPPVSGSMAWIFRPDARSGIGYQDSTIRDGDSGTADTIAPMIRLAREGANHPGIREATQRAVRMAGVGPKDYAGELRAIYNYVKANCRYMLDPRGKEQISHPAHTLFVSGTEDCDSLAVLEVAMAGSIGHGGAFRTVKADPRRPDEYSHVYALLAYTDESGVHWIPADVTQQGTDFGWEPPPERVYYYKDWVAIPP